MHPLRTLLSVAAGFAVCAATLWPIPYREVSLPSNPSPTLWLVLGSSAGMFAGYLLPSGWRAPWLSVAGGFVLAVIARIGFETARDPTSHNLWPFEVIIAGGFGLAAGLVGVALARVAQRLGRVRG